MFILIAMYSVEIYGSGAPVDAVNAVNGTYDPNKLSMRALYETSSPAAWSGIA